MVADGEGATKTLEMRVTGARDVAQARTIARAIINSNLVKTALYGEDPNWGRIVAAAGAARAGLDPQTWSLYRQRQTVGGRGAASSCSPRPRRIANSKSSSIAVRAAISGMGEAAATGVGLRPLARLRAHQCELSHVIGPYSSAGTATTDV